jgi:cytochrome c oxidase subunit 4
MKASLVAAFFMHLRHDKLFNTIAFLAAFLFLGIFILLTYDDVGVRAEDHGSSSYSEKVLPQTGAEAPGGAPATTATTDFVGNGKGGGEKKE